MNKDDLVKLGIDASVAEQVIILHGKDIEKHKSSLSTAQAELEGLRTQLTDANKAIESFKSMDIEGIKRASEDWKAKAEAAQKEAETKVAQLKFDYALDGALTGAKARSPKAVRALLQLDQLKLNEDGSIIGLKEQLEKVQSENDYLFESDAKDPRIVTGGNGKKLVGDPVVIAMRQAAGLPTE